MSDQPDPYGWDAWVLQTDHRIVGKMIRDKCEQLRQARLVCQRAAAGLRDRQAVMSPNQSAYRELTALIAEVDAEGKKP